MADREVPAFVLADFLPYQLSLAANAAGGAGPGDCAGAARR
jgi:hypothetical protein